VAPPFIVRGLKIELLFVIMRPVVKVCSVPHLLRELRKLNENHQAAGTHHEWRMYNYNYSFLIFVSAAIKAQCFFFCLVCFVLVNLYL
jgi:hypothetical protein